MENTEESTEKTEAKLPELPNFPVKITSEMAGKDVLAWLDYKKVKPLRRQALAPQIFGMVEAVAYGDIVIDPTTFVITHTLNFPICDKEGNAAVKELKYKPRVTVEEMEVCLGQVNAQDPVATARATGAAISGQPLAYMGKLDTTTDMRVMSDIANFF